MTLKDLLVFEAKKAAPNEGASSGFNLCFKSFP